MTPSGCEELSEARLVDLARECVYRFLSAVVTEPYTTDWERVRNPHGHEVALAAMAVLRARAEREPIPLDIGELGAEALDLAPLAAELSSPGADLRAEYDRVFGFVIPKECPPYETEYHPPAQSFLRSQQLADIAGFYRAFGLDPGGIA